MQVEANNSLDTCSRKRLVRTNSLEELRNSRRANKIDLQSFQSPCSRDICSCLYGGLYEAELPFAQFDPFQRAHLNRSEPCDVRSIVGARSRTGFPAYDTMEMVPVSSTVAPMRRLPQLIDLRNYEQTQRDKRLRIDSQDSQRDTPFFQSRIISPIAADSRVDPRLVAGRKFKTIDLAANGISKPPAAQSHSCSESRNADRCPSQRKNRSQKSRELTSLNDSENTKLGKRRRSLKWGSKNESGRTTFADVVHAHLVKTGFQKLAVGHHPDVTVNVLPEGSILYKGVVYNSISSFALAVIRERNPGRRSCDGWKDVKYEGQRLEALRKKYELGSL